MIIQMTLTTAATGLRYRRPFKRAQRIQIIDFFGGVITVCSLNFLEKTVVKRKVKKLRRNQGKKGNSRLRMLSH